MLTRRQWTTLAALLALIAGLGGWALTTHSERDPNPGAGASAPAPSAPESWPVAVDTAPPGQEPGDGAWTDPAGVDRSDPEAVAAAFAGATVQFDTTTDTTQTAAVLRARELMTDRMAATVVEPARLNPAPGWAQAAQLDGYSSVTVREVGHHAHTVVVDPVTGASTRPFTFQVAWGWQGRNPVTTLEGGTRTVQLNLVHDGAGQWAVDGYATEEPLTTVNH